MNELSENRVIVNDSTTVEDNIQKSLVAFCKKLPEHLKQWKEVLKETKEPLQGLLNLSEQIQHVSKSNLNETDERAFSKDDLTCILSQKAEDELQLLKQNLELLNKANNDLKNKLVSLEKFSLDLDWEQDSFLVNGTCYQPPLKKILTMGYEYCKYFGELFKKINCELKSVDFSNKKKMDDLKLSFEIDLDEESDICYVIAVTQYVENSKALI